MIPHVVEQNRVASSSTEKAFEATLNQNNLLHLMTLLANMYSDVELAVIREYICNALDANKAAGSVTPVRITFPTEGGPQFSVRDTGIGMDDTAFRNTFMSYGSSTKTHTNDAVGFMGIGAKCGYAYESKSFSVTLFSGTTATVYSCFLADAKTPSSQKVTEYPCDAPRGVDVTIPVRNVSEFQKKLARFLFGVSPDLYVVDNKPADIQVRYILDTVCSSETLRKDLSGFKISVTKPDFMRNEPLRGGFYVLMGSTMYPVGAEVFAKSKLQRDAHSLTQSVNILIEAPLGAFTPAPSREALIIGSKDSGLLNNLMDEFIGSFVNSIKKSIDDLPKLTLTSSDFETLTQLTKIYQEAINHFFVKRVPYIRNTTTQYFTNFFAGVTTQRIKDALTTGVLSPAGLYAYNRAVFNVLSKSPYSTLWLDKVMEETAIKVAEGYAGKFSVWQINFSGYSSKTKTKPLTFLSTGLYDIMKPLTFSTSDPLLVLNQDGARAPTRVATQFATAHKLGTAICVSGDVEAFKEFFEKVYGKDSVEIFSAKKLYEEYEKENKSSASVLNATTYNPGSMYQITETVDITNGSDGGKNSVVVMTQNAVILSEASSATTRRVSGHQFAAAMRALKHPHKVVFINKSEFRQYKKDFEKAGWNIIDTPMAVAQLFSPVLVNSTIGSFLGEHHSSVSNKLQRISRLEDRLTTLGTFTPLSSEFLQSCTVKTNLLKTLVKKLVVSKTVVSNSSTTNIYYDVRLIVDGIRPLADTLLSTDTVYQAFKAYSAWATNRLNKLDHYLSETETALAVYVKEQFVFDVDTRILADLKNQKFSNKDLREITTMKGYVLCKNFKKKCTTNPPLDNLKTTV